MAPAAHVSADSPEDRLADKDPGSDAQTFAAFYAAEYRSVLAFAASLCRDRHAAEDLTQDAFIAAQRRWSSLRSFDRPDLWIRRVVANRSASRWRALRGDQRRIERLVTQRKAEHRNDAASDEDIWQLVRQLPARQAQVVALTYLEDRPLADVAAVLGIGVETAKTHLQRGRATLARLVAASETEEPQ